VKVEIFRKTGKTYAGQMRKIFAKECDGFHRPLQDAKQRGGSKATSICIESDDEPINTDRELKKLSLFRKRIERSPSVEVIDSHPRSGPLQFGKKKSQYTFADCFCGAGGASRGAQNAGLRVVWGLDKTALACEAWHANFPGAQIFNYDAHDFPPRDLNIRELRVDMLHLSPPCTFFSPAHVSKHSFNQKST
jgi:DNA (cytosine-5)-methyltransferase 1